MLSGVIAISKVIRGGFDDFFAPENPPNFNGIRKSEVASYMSYDENGNFSNISSYKLCTQLLNKPSHEKFSPLCGGIPFMYAMLEMNIRGDRLEIFWGIVCRKNIEVLEKVLRLYINSSYDPNLAAAIMEGVENKIELIIDGNNIKLKEISKPNSKPVAEIGRRVDFYETT